MAENQKRPTEEFKVTGEALLSKVREIVHEGNARRIIIKDDSESGRAKVRYPRSPTPRS
jgi:hypothetical protein